MIHPSSQEHRRKALTKTPPMIRVRPPQPTSEEFDKILPTLNASRNSAYFVPQNTIFELDMRVFVSYPYSSGPDSINREFLGTVRRVDKLPGNKQGVTVH
jgi:hypothetical protein